VLPELFAAEVLTSYEQATACLREYQDLLLKIARQTDQSDPTVADEFLVALADYANYYDLIVAMRVPLDEPFIVKTAERRDLRLSPLSNSGTQELVIADAQTNHVTFKVPDPNVRIRRFGAIMPNSDGFSYGAFQSRQSPQNRAFTHTIPTATTEFGCRSSSDFCGACSSFRTLSPVFWSSWQSHC